MKRSLRTIIPVAVSAAIIALCLWIPSLFITKDPQQGGSETPPPGQETENTIQISDKVLPMETRLSMWRAFWNGEPGYGSEKTPLGGLDDEKLSRYDQGYIEKVAPLSMFFIDTEDNSTSSVNYEYIVYYDSNGSALRLFHVYREWTGDWKNWTELYFDADDATIYYFYISSGCRSNYDKYAGVMTDYQADGAAQLWAQMMGTELESLDWTGDPADPAYATYLVNGVHVNCQVNWIYYEANLFDFKILVI